MFQRLAAFYIAAEARLSNSFSTVDVRRTIIDFGRLQGRSPSACVVPAWVAVQGCCRAKTLYACLPTLTQVSGMTGGKYEHGSV